MTLSAGTRSGPYEIVSPLGAGGMGEVYRASDARLGREVAIKVLPPRLAEDADALARFEREARAVAALSHPNILAIHDFGKTTVIAREAKQSDPAGSDPHGLSGLAMTEGPGAGTTVTFAVTELLEGETLRERLSGGALASRRATEYALAIAHGLAAAHGKGIVHRDLKPDNIFLTRDGRVKILDFGLAKTAGPAGSRDDTHSPTLAIATEPGMIMGTVGYMSPEQVRGLPVDARSDIFSFGAVLYEMLAGKRAFQRDTAAETMTAILKEDPPDVAASNPNLSPALDRIVRHCLEKSPEQRFESARDLAFSLETLSDRSVTSKTPFPAARRNPRVAMIVAAAGIAAAAGLVGAWIGRGKPSEPPAVHSLTYSGHDHSPAVSPDGRTLAFCSERDGHPRIWLKQLAGGAEAAVTSGSDDFPRFSPDGSSILFIRTNENGSSIYEIPTVGGEPRRLVANAFEADWSPDGRRVAFCRNRTVNGRIGVDLAIVDSEGNGEKQLARLENFNIAGPRFSPDGTSVVVSRGAGNTPASMYIVPLDGGKPSTLDPSRRLGQVMIPAFTGRRGEVLYGQVDSTIGFFAGSASRLLLQRIGSRDSRTLAWLPGFSNRVEIAGPGSVVAESATSRGNLQEVTLSSSREAGGARWLTRGNSNDRQPSFSSDGDWMAFSSDRSGNLDIWVMSAKTGAIHPITHDAAQDWDPCFSRDGKLLAWSSNRGGHFEVWAAAADGSGAHQVTRDGSDGENPVFSPDGRWIVYVSYNPAKLGIWKIRLDGTEATRLVSGSYVWGEISPDGRYVAFAEALSDLTAPLNVEVVRFADGKPTSFKSRVQNRFGGAGRSRWMPDGQSLAFIGVDENGSSGIYIQKFDPDHDTAATRRKLAGFDPEIPTETFGISPDGKHLVLEGLETSSNLALVEGLDRIEPPKRLR